MGGHQVGGGGEDGSVATTDMENGFAAEFSFHD